MMMFSVAVLCIDRFIQMTEFPATKGFTGLPAKTMPCPVVSVGKSFHTLCWATTPPHHPWCHGNMYAEAGSGVCVCVCLVWGCWRVFSICGIICRGGVYSGNMVLKVTGAD